MKRILIVNLVLALILLGIAKQQAKADFIVDPDPGGLKFFIEKPANPTTIFWGDVGDNNSGVLVKVVTDVNVTTGNGYTNIKPDQPDNKKPPLTLRDLIFIPNDPNLFGDFSFRGQLVAAGIVTINVWDNQGGSVETFAFNISNANQDFDRVGIIAAPGNGETIKQVEIIYSGGFKEVKQIDFSYAAVPEPATMLLLGSGLIGVGVFVRRRFKR